MRSLIVKRSIVLAGHKTSLSLEDAFWRGLKDIAASRRIRVAGLVYSIDTKRGQGNLSSAVRLFVLNHYQARQCDRAVKSLGSPPPAPREVAQVARQFVVRSDRVHTKSGE